MREKTIKLYKFDELSEEIQEKVINIYADINIDTGFEWWEMDGLLDLTDEEMKNRKIKLSKKWYESSKEKDKNGNIIGEYPAYTGLIKYKIIAFDLDRGNIAFKDIEITNDDIFRKFLKIPKRIWEKCDYYFDNKREQTYFEIEYDGNETEKIKEIIENAQDIMKYKIADALSELKSNYEYLTSEEAIKEHIILNEMEFREDGKRE